MCRKKTLRLIYQENFRYFEVENGALVDTTDLFRWDEMHPPALEFEILQSFFNSFDIYPYWIPYWSMEKENKSVSTC